MPVIRPATIQDLPGLYRVCLLTGDSGRDGSGLFRNQELLGHVYVGPYVVGEPDLALVVADEDGAAGYLLAAADTRAFEAWEEADWWPSLRASYPRRTHGTPEAELVGVIHAPPRAPDEVVADFPAHLHIDLLERVRGHGYGRTLIDGLEARLRDRGVAGVHLEVAADNANGLAFYEHLGYRHLGPHRDALLMGKRLA